VPILEDYDEFQGLHWETGSLRNYLAYKGVTAPHTKQPFSEAMLLGVSGGIVMGYFTFDYEGLDPTVRILTRNTFNPLETIYERLAIKTTVIQTAKADKGVQNLLAVLDSGSPAIVVADMFSLPYNVLEYDEGMWAMLPILVYGYDQDINKVWIADRSERQLCVTIDELASARGRTKKNKFRLLVHEPPNPDNLEQVVIDGIRDCVNLFTQPPPKGSRNNFGFLAYQKWIDLLLKPNQRGSWHKQFAPGSRMYAGLLSAFEDISIFGKNGGADRTLYAQFLDEASILLSNPVLKEIANQFEESAEAWNVLAASLLPDEVPLFKETRTLVLEKHRIFLKQGSRAMEEMRNIRDRLTSLRTLVGEEFPLNDSQAEELRFEIAKRVSVVKEIETKAIEDLRLAISS
jgi:hypothetical protein